MRWDATTVSLGMHAGLVVGLVVLPRPPRPATPAPPLLPLDIRLTHPAPDPGPGPAPGPAPVPVPAPVPEPAPGPAPAPAPVPAPVPVPVPAPVPPPPPVVPSPAALARGLVEEVRPSSRSPLDPPAERTHREAPLPGVAADGTAHFEDRSGPTAETVTPERMKRVIVHELDEWGRDPYAYQGRLGQSDGVGKWLVKPLNPLTNPARVADSDAKGTMIYIPLLTGTFDVTDEVARRRGRETDVHAKLRFLYETRERRAEMAVTERAHLAREAVYRLSERLAKIWDDDRRTPRERRVLLFGLWDECEDSDSGRTARASILGFIRRRLPAGAPDAYSADEIAELNRHRASRAAFAPY